MPQKFLLIIVLALLAGTLPFCEAITYGIPLHATARRVVFPSCLITLGYTEACPVISKLIFVGHDTERGKISITAAKSFHFIRGQWAHTSIVIIRRSTALDGSEICREEHVNHQLPYRSSGWKRGSLVGVHNLNNHSAIQLESWAFTNIFSNKNHLHIGVKTCGHGGLCFDPRALLNLEVMFQVLPLKESNDGISDGEWNSDQFHDRFPPVQGLIPGLLGLIGIAWGWWNLRYERYLPLSGITFLVGCAFWAAACFILLPWLADL